MNGNRMERQKTDWEALFCMAAGALMNAIGLLAFWGGITGNDIWELGGSHVAGILTGLFTGIFAALLLSSILKHKC